MRFSLQPGQSPASVKERLLRGGKFDIDEGPSRLRLSRRRMVPRRGIFRLFIPRVRVDVSFAEGAAIGKLRLDGLALFMCVLLVGGLIVETTMDRVKYPREYPPAFIYALAGIYFVLIVVEIFATRRVLGASLGAPEQS